MNPIDALKMSFQSPVNQTTKASRAKTEGAATTELGAFSQLLASASAEVKESGTEPAAEIQAKLEKVLEALQDLPQEELTPEQQEMLSAMVQLLSLQVKQLENSLQEQGLAQSNMGLAEPPKLPAEAANQEKTTVLLQQIHQKLAQLTTNDITEFEMPMDFTGVDAENLDAEPEQMMKQLTQLIQELESGEAVSGKPAASQQSEKVEQILTQLTQLRQDLESYSSPAETLKTTAVSTHTAAVSQPQEIAGLEVEAAPQAEPATAAPVEGAKAQAGQTVPRTEAAAPTVRMANMVEDLSGLLRGSMRLTGNGENAQIKVSIFPEHLGHLDIRLATVDGKVAAQIFTSSLMAKEAIEMQLNQLRNTMLQQGVNLDRVEITQQSPQQSFGQQSANPEQRFTQQQKHGTSANRNGYQRIEEETAAVTGRSQAPDGSMMKVDYTI